MRNTLQKQIVKDALYALGNHPTAEEVYTEVHKDHPSVSKATVYRILGNMAESKNALRLVCPGGADCFDHRLDSHYHIKCEKCGRIYDVDIPYMENLNDLVSKEFTVFSHQIIFSGICRNCKNEGSK